MQTSQPKTIQQDQRGFASMVIALILILVMALLSIGFAQLARREQQNSLAKQLANQANYAAESAINDAVVDIRKGLITNTTVNPGNGTVCIKPSDLPLGAASKNPSVDGTHGVAYSCLLVNLEPPSLIKQPLDIDKGWAIAFDTSAPLDSLKISWKSHAAGRTAQAAFNGTGFQPTASWGTHPAVLQFSITPVGGNILGGLFYGSDRNSLINNTFTAYLYPSSGGGSVAYAKSNSNSNAPVISGGCTGGANTTCAVTITNIYPLGLGLIGTTGPILMHIIDYYDPSDIIVTGTAQALLGGSSPVNFINGQAQIDATGKAKNVLKRLQARVSINHPNLPDFAIEAGDLCKRFSTIPSNPLDPLAPTTTYDTATDPSCSLSNGL